MHSLDSLRTINMIPTDVNLLSLKHATNIPKLVTTIPNVFVNVGLSIPNKTKTKNTTTGLKLLIICIKLTLKYKYSVFPLANVIAVNKPIGIIIVTYSHSVNVFVDRGGVVDRERESDDREQIDAVGVRDDYYSDWFVHGDYVREREHAVFILERQFYTDD
jgi:hypothetical protein